MEKHSCVGLIHTRFIRGDIFSCYSILFVNLALQMLLPLLKHLQLRSQAQYSILRCILAFLRALPSEPTPDARHDDRIMAGHEQLSEMLSRLLALGRLPTPQESSKLRFQMMCGRGLLKPKIMWCVRRGYLLFRRGSCKLVCPSLSAGLSFEMKYRYNASVIQSEPRAILAY